MADKQPRQRAHRFEPVPQQHSIGMAATEAALPIVGAVMELGQLIVQRFIVSWKRADAMPGEVRALNSVLFNRAGKSKSPGRTVHGSGCDGTPGSMRMEASPLIEQHTLRAFKQ